MSLSLEWYTPKFWGHVGRLGSVPGLKVEVAKYA